MVEIRRKKDDGINTIGQGRLIKRDVTVMTFATLELAFRQNKQRISAIPAGTYKCRRYLSSKFGMCWRVGELNADDVIGRKHILIHPANYASSDERYKSDLKGCIAFGLKHGDLNKDGVVDLLDSRLIHQAFNKELKNVNEFKLVIENDF